VNCEFYTMGFSLFESYCEWHADFMVSVFGTARSVLVLNGNGADLAKHAIPAVPSER